MDYDNDFFIQAQGLIERVMRSYRQTLVDTYGKVESELKKDNSLVTKMDQLIEKDLREALTGFDKNIGLHGEEYGKEGNPDTFWLIDPIDGTENYIRGMPNFQNMVTLIDRGEPVFTVVYRPVTDDLYVAAKGEGTYRNGLKIEMKERPISRTQIEFTGNASIEDGPAIWKAVYDKIWNFKMGDFLLTPEGKLDGQLVYKSKGDIWDFAPRALLISEAGGKVANIGSDRYDYTNNDFLGAHPAIFDELMVAINTALKS